MKFSEQWLREWVNPGVDSDDLSAQLTMAGLEVDAIEPVAGDFSGVVVAEITAAERHPDADKLQVCQVSNGQASFQIVCGAANARVGIKVPMAMVGAILPGNFKIKKAKLRGVESFGMLCAEQELGMAEQSDGLFELPSDAPLGEDIRSYLGLDDKLIELGLTPNRADCLSIRGVAREAAVLNNMAFAEPAQAAVEASIDDQLTVKIAAPDHCARYVGRVVRGVNMGAESPLWLQEKLRRCGSRSIDPVVDVTNLVMLELGQPMHAFDLSAISGAVHVRTATPGESLELLDGQTLELRDDSLLIADDEKPLALAGIMGGQSSAVSAATQDLFLESAFFTPEKLAGKARSYGLHTDASHRFERGVDFALAERAIERATELILQICGGKAGPLTEASSDALPSRSPVILREARIEKMLGMPLLAKEVEQILTGLGMQVERQDSGWMVTPPSWRFDIAIEVDLLEELARVYGYNRLPVKPIRSELAIKSRPEGQRAVMDLRQHLVSRGYQEAISYSFVDPVLNAKLSEREDCVTLLNPISADMAQMRDSLLPGLLKTAEYNSKRQQARLRFFEIGQRFVPSAEGLAQIPTLGALLSGRRDPENWSSGGELLDFFDLKGDLEALITPAATPLRFEAAQHKALHPGQTANVYQGEHCVGRIGALHPSLQSDLDLPSAVYFFEIDLDALLEVGVPAFKPVSRYPELRRDLAVILPSDVTAQSVLDCVQSAAGELLVNLKLFDIYQGKGIDPERKSLGLGLTYRHSSRTLNEEEVTLSVEAVVQALQDRFGASLRN
ncbi:MULTISPECIES: phenylalanine--tRNA ligase subunit beta [unclassified Spongiibacter]|uniref:phenylalanine--tRNA ligase subunit beta n=1 Tax=unclassified Spongiibacter TaxID=2631504 RepID=UPI000C091822|nr:MULTISPECIES: phenylalanine--tRNA ligase subunit beta [unclassified Spongiibacter]MAK43058.1 phenylalanine--tRNA ligase subunit beta [Spongiibacter sp.]|tara:strand:+ start:14413 stop:16779 length:2367 start_codon:yes stop_codon:yes gene_type:complete